MNLSDSLGPDIIKLAEEKGIGSVSIHKILKQSGRDISRTTVTRILRDYRNKLGKPRPPLMRFFSTGRKSPNELLMPRRAEDSFL